MSIFTHTAAIAAGAITFVAAYTASDALLPPPIEGVGRYESPVRAGEAVLVEWDLVKRTDCPGFTSRVWDGERNYHLTEPAQRTTLPAHSIERRIETKIPELVPVGELRLTIVGVYQCAGGRKQAFTLGPVSFEVVE